MVQHDDKRRHHPARKLFAIAMPEKKTAGLVQQQFIEDELRGPGHSNPGSSFTFARISPMNVDQTLLFRANRSGDKRQTRRTLVSTRVFSPLPKGLFAVPFERLELSDLQREGNRPDSFYIKSRKGCRLALPLVQNVPARSTFHQSLEELLRKIQWCDDVWHSPSEIGIHSFCLNFIILIKTRKHMKKTSVCEKIAAWCLLMAAST